MYQRKEKTEKNIPGGHEGVLDLFKLLESTNPEEVESVKNVIYENLSTAKDSRLLNCIVDYYMAVQSERSLDILIRVKDPHDKHLFDKLNELIKSETTCYQSLQLLCNLIYKQSSWIYKIANHRLMHSLFQLLKNDVHAPNLISALLIIVCLLPMIPSQFGPYLSDTFDVFSRLISWNLKKPSAISETCILHLQVGVYSLFHRLYGMFPCNFLAYLRSYYGGRDYSEENFRVFTLFIKPMLERVRLHPLLVTASKETELSANRWKKMEYHDVISDCASISLDAIEGTLEGLRGKSQNSNSLPRRHGNFSAQNSLQYVSLSSQSSITSLTLEPGSTVNEALTSHRDSLWSPSHSYSSTAPQPLTLNTTASASIKSESEMKYINTQLSIEESVPFDLAVEAKPEELKDTSSCQKSPNTTCNAPKPVFKSCNEDPYKVDTVSISSEKNNADKDSLGVMNTSIETNVLQGVEAKEEDIDKEVSELTSPQNKSIEVTSVEERYDTPFCSTTQTLTDEPTNLMTSAVLKSENVEMLIKSHDEEVDEMYGSMQDPEEETFVPSFNRYRYVSQCGPAPVIPSESMKRPKVVRSISCPAKFCPINQSSIAPEKISGVDNASKPETVVVTCSNSVITTSSAFVSITNNVILTASRNFTYEQLIPMAMEPLPDICQPPSASLESNYHSYNTLFSSSSPPELLDNYIQLGSVTYANQLSSIPITSTKNTDWTHFGGKPPPDEVDILRKQILLLHNQLLFERHRKDVHSERIRRILGRAKKSKMQEELIIALKEQINLLVKENEDLKYELSQKTKMEEQFKLEKKQIEAELNSSIKKYKFKNTELLFSNNKLQNLLVSQKDENDQIIAECKAAQSKIVDLETELDLCKQEVECYRKLKKESEFLSKQLFLLQEINNLYKEKIEQLKASSNPNNIGDDLFNEAAAIEIHELKRKLETTCFQFEATKSRIVELEQQLNNMKQKEKEQYKLVESIKSFHQDEIKVCDEHSDELKKICVQKDAFILQLHKEKEILLEKIKNLEKKLNGASHSTKESCDITPCHEENTDLPHSSGFSESLLNQS